MIEVVYSSNEKDTGRNNDVIRLPKNIKQIGDVKGSKKIYIEDYAINFISEAHLGENGPIFGILVGNIQKSGVDRYVFIKGAIKVPDVFISESEISVSDSDWAQLYETMGQYFTNQEIVGWFLSLDGINASSFRTIKKTHLNLFAGGEKTLFVFDRQENEKYFCIYENEQLMRKKGYVIYYERNEEMQNYLVDQRSQEQIKLEKYNSSFSNDDNGINDVNINLKENDDAGKIQSFVNYCANVAMVALVLFIGVYFVNNRNKLGNTLVSNEPSTTITSVIKVDGEVYPTTESPILDTTFIEENTAPTTLVSEFQSVNDETIRMAESESMSESVAEKETTSQESVTTEPSSAGYITVNNNVVIEEHKEHVVKKGDSLYTISKKYYGDYSKIDEIMKLNKIDNMDKIYIGQTIKLP